MSHPVEKVEQLLFEVLGHVLEAKARESLFAAIKMLDAVKYERNQHNELIRVCSSIITDEDGSSLIPNWARVQNALMRVISDRDSYKAALKDLYDVASDGMIADDTLCMLNAERLLEDE